MLKEYTSPVLKILCFAPVERLALLPGEAYAQMLGATPSAQAASGEVDVSITSNPDGEP